MTMLSLSHFRETLDIIFANMQKQQRQQYKKQSIGHNGWKVDPPF